MRVDGRTIKSRIATPSTLDITDATPPRISRLVLACTTVDLDLTFSHFLLAFCGGPLAIVQIDRRPVKINGLFFALRKCATATETHSTRRVSHFALSCSRLRTQATSQEGTDDNARYAAHRNADCSRAMSYQLPCPPARRRYFAGGAADTAKVIHNVQYSDICGHRDRLSTKPGIPASSRNLATPCRVRIRRTPPIARRLEHGFRFLCIALASPALFALAAWEEI